MKQKTLFLRMSVVLMMMPLSACTYSKITPEAVSTDPAINPSTSRAVNTTTGKTTSSSTGTTSGITTTADGTTTSDKSTDGTTTGDNFSTTGDKSGELPEDLNVPPTDGSSSSGKGTEGTSSGDGTSGKNVSSDPTEPIVPITSKGTTTGGASTPSKTGTSGKNVSYGSTDSIAEITPKGTTTGVEIPLFAVDEGDSAGGFKGTTTGTSKGGTTGNAGGGKGVSTSNLCGNGRIDSGEVCDDGNTIDGDGCENTCASRAYKIAYASSDAAGRNYSLKTSIIRILPGSATLKPNTTQTLMTTSSIPISSPAVSGDGNIIAYNQHDLLGNTLGLVSLNENGAVASQRNVPSLSIAGVTHVFGAFPSWKGNSLAFMVRPSSPPNPWTIYSGATINPTTLEITGGDILLRSGTEPAMAYKHLSAYRSTMVYEGDGIYPAGESHIEVIDPRCDHEDYNPMNTCNLGREGDEENVSAPIVGKHPSLAFIDQKLMMAYSHTVDGRKQISLCEVNFVPRLVPTKSTCENVLCEILGGTPPRFLCENIRNLTSVGDNHSPSFTRDGKYVFFTQEVNGNKDIYVMSVDSPTIMLAIGGETQDYDAAVFPIALPTQYLHIGDGGNSSVFQEQPLADTGKGGVEEQPILKETNKGTSSSGK